jgi:hypothetical protein
MTAPLLCWSGQDHDAEDVRVESTTLNDYDIES